jgi:FkbM family methyltransferase
VPDIVYCDVGAAHPVVDSISKSLHQLKWRGIHIEPVPAYAALLRAQREGDVVVECGAGDTDRQLDFWFVPGSGLSTTSAAEAERAEQRGFAVHRSSIRVRPLADLLDEHLARRTLHVLKIDVEGAERDVLLGADLSRFRPWVVLVEATRPGSIEPTHEAWEELVLNAGYRLTMFDGLNRWYCSKEHPELVPALSYPACPLDGWIRAGLGFPQVARGDAAEVQALAALEVMSAFSRLHAAEKDSGRASERSAALGTQLKDLRGRVKGLETQIEEAAKRTVTLERQLAAIRSSQWWRLTAPGRRVTSGLRRLIRR